MATKKIVAQDLLITNNNDSIKCEFLSMNDSNYIVKIHNGCLIYHEEYSKASIKKLITDYYIYKQLIFNPQIDRTKYKLKTKN